MNLLIQRRSMAKPPSSLARRHTPQVTEADKILTGETVELSSGGSLSKVATGWLRKTGLALCLGAALAGSFTPPATAHSVLNSQEPAVVLSIDNKAESALLKESRTSSQLVELHQGRSGQPTMITVHGIHGSPLSLQPVAQTAADDGYHVKAFAYHDSYRRQTDMSLELAEDVAQWRQDNPEAPLVLVGPSMGARVVLGAMKHLKDTNQLGDAPYQLKLVAPVLGGVESANHARHAPDWLAEKIPDVAPSKDMGSRSDFQGIIESAQFGDNVTADIYLGDTDHVVRPDSSGFKTIQSNLKAEVHQFQGGHSDIMDDLWNILE